MKNFFGRTAFVVFACMGFSQLSLAESPVLVTEKQATHKLQVTDVLDDIKPMYPAPGRKLRTIDYTFPLVTLNNGRVEVVIAPTLGMRVVNAVDLRTGKSFAGTSDPRRMETEDFSDVIGWTAGYQEVSFPYYEHGVGVREEAGYRILHGDDGSVILAMNMCFTQNQEPRNMARYGRYSPRRLSAWVTLRPGESRYRITYRLDNPWPLPHSSRLWTNIILYADGYDEEHILYPAGYIMPHGGQSVSPFFAADGRRKYSDVSHFALFSEYGFCGVYSPDRDTNCLIAFDPSRSPGMKLYASSGDKGRLELWIGTTPVFEDPGSPLGEFVPLEYSIDFHNASGIGRVSYANADVAIAACDGKFKLVAPFAVKARVTDGAGKTLAEGSVDVDKPLDGGFDKRIAVEFDGKIVADVTFPLEYADTRARLAEVSRQGGIYRLEMEENTNHLGEPTGRDAIDECRLLLATGKPADIGHAMSLARTAYRYGHLDLAGEMSNLTKSPESDYLRGLIAYEKGHPTDFGRAGVEANYLRALQAVQKGDTAGAIRLLNAMLTASPKAYRPRLLYAWLSKDVVAAEKLATENPASPEAQLVLEMLGDPAARGAREALCRSNPDASRQVDEFCREITSGQWSPPRRFEPALPNRVLILLGEGFNAEEFWQPYLGLIASGYDVDIASSQAGTVTAGSKDRSLDARANLSLREVQASRYAGLVIPGGGGPANLEKHPEAVEICRQFMLADKPVGAICHGPRLLARAGALRGRVCTYLAKVSDELPEEFAKGELGVYVDEEVVVDGNLVTSRYPLDTVAFLKAFLGKCAESGGIPLPWARPRVIVMDPKSDRPTLWAFVGAASGPLSEVRRVKPSDIPAVLADKDNPPWRYHALVVLDGADTDSLKSNAGFVKLVNYFADRKTIFQDHPATLVLAMPRAAAMMRDANLAPQGLLELPADRGLAVRQVVRISAAEADRRAVRRTAPPSPSSVMALADGFDDSVVIAMDAFLRACGRKVLVVGPRKGWIRGRWGTPREATATYDEMSELTGKTVVVAPGVFAPSADFTQAGRRIDWLMQRYKNGDVLVVFGFDSLAVGKSSLFKGKYFATSDQLQWNFGDAGRYSPAPAVRSADRLISAKGGSAVVEAMQLLPAEMSDGQSQPATRNTGLPEK
jgi:protease I